MDGCCYHPKYLKTLFGQVSYRMTDFISLKLGINKNKAKEIQQKYFYKYDLALHPSLKESGPLVVLEYLSQGLPFLSFNTGQSNVLVKEHFPEFIMLDFEEKKWASQLMVLIDKGREFYQNNLKKFFKKKYSQENYLLKCRKIYQTSLS